DDVSDDVAGHDPDMAGLINRDADNWRSLFAIAELIGSDWPERAREAAAALTLKDSESIGPMLLGDIKAAFDEQAVDRLSSVDVCAALNNMEGKPWGDWKGKELTPNQLARLPKPFALPPTRPFGSGPRRPRVITAISSRKCGNATSRAKGLRGRMKGHKVTTPMKWALLPPFKR